MSAVDIHDNLVAMFRVKLCALVRSRTLFAAGVSERSAGTGVH
jgi:hypothetical protein